MAMNVNIDKVICISLRSHNKSQLDSIGETYDISLDCLLQAKEAGCKKLWIHVGGGIVIAAVDTDNIDDIYFSPQYLPMTSKLRKSILSLKPVKTPKVTKSKLESFVTVDELLEDLDFELNVDDILDKINLKGMSSLSQKELEFLKGLSK